MTEELKPFQKVLVRQLPDSIWEASLFSRKSEASSTCYCMGVFYRYCIPYEGNEGLLGTTDSPKQGFQWGDHVEVRNNEESDWLKAVYLAESVGDLCYSVVLKGASGASLFRYCRHADW